MNLLLLRHSFTEKYTEGFLFLNGGFYGYTLEDMVRPPGIKIPGKTAIPKGEYKVTVEKSPKFGKLLPKLHDVPGFEGILIHGGNTAEDSLGCILLARSRPTPGTLHGSLSAALTERLSFEPGPHSIRILEAN